jgi:hypothetical protein
MANYGIIDSFVLKSLTSTSTSKIKIKIKIINVLADANQIDQRRSIEPTPIFLPSEQLPNAHRRRNWQYFPNFIQIANQTIQNRDSIQPKNQKYSTMEELPPLHHKLRKEREEIHEYICLQRGRF